MSRASQAKPKSVRLTLSVQYPAGQTSAPTRPQVRRWVRAALLPDLAEAEVTVRFVDEMEGRQLNAHYRQKGYATNVLSFPYVHDKVLLGDLAICVPVVLVEAAEQRKDPLAHFAHLVVHGMLHLQSWDHETGPEEAERMETMERTILASLGVSDPYAERP